VAGFVVKRVLMVAFHYPPAFGSSGVQRALKFSQYLPEHGWQPLVLTVHPRAHAIVSEGQLEDVPSGLSVKRAFALDAARHLAIRGRYPRTLALPDRWGSWVLGGVPAGLALIRKYRPQVIWSTYPIATAMLIGLLLHRLTGLPWVGDLRDPLVDDDFPLDPPVRRAHQWIEERVVRHAACTVFTAPGTQRIYQERYALDPARTICIPNGYDEENFARASRLLERASPPSRRVHLVHSGILYPQDRDPTTFFAALAGLARRGLLTPGDLRVTLRATGHDEHLQGMIGAAGVSEFVRLAPAVPYAEALAEMMAADGLLIFQAGSCNHQIPAKLYEYLRSGRPILALTDPSGDTAGTLQECGAGNIARLDDAADVESALQRFLEQIRADSAPRAPPDVAARYSRRAQTAHLAALFDGQLTTIAQASQAHDRG
jgi:glycosyltransferase involved in cell wall biosynthesis